MGKSSKYPNYSNGSITINGSTVSSSKKNGNSIDSSYNMSENEKAIYDGIQSNLSSALNNLFTISDDKQKQFNQELEAYKTRGINQINAIYDPMVTDLTNNIASRFGNLDNSIFMDNLSNITNNKAEAVADFSNSLLEKQSELYSNEYKNQLNYITLLSGLNDSINSNILSYMALANNNAATGNNYNQTAYQANMNNNWLNTTNQMLTVAGKFANLMK